MNIRIEWKIGESTGHGEWQDNDQQTVISLWAWVDIMDKEFGIGTHWIGYKE